MKVGKRRMRKGASNLSSSIHSQSRKLLRNSSSQMNVIAAKSIYKENSDNRAMKIIEPFLLQQKDKPTYGDNRGKAV